MAYDAKTNWQLNDVVKPEDINRIEQGIKDLDIGKLTKTATVILGGADLNEYTDIGIYTWSSSNSSSIVNCPVVGQATMLVLPRLLNYEDDSVANITQIIFSQISSRSRAGVWIRLLVSDEWYEWNQLSTGEDFASVAKYNLAAATKTSLGTVETSVNPLPTDWIQVVEGTHYQKNGFVIKASDWYTAGPSPVKNAFDGNASTQWRASVVSGDVWVSFELPEAQVVNTLNIVGALTLGSATRFIIQGSINGSTWTQLYSTTNVSGEFNVVADLNNETSYKYYRILVTLASGSNLVLKEVKITSIRTTTFSKAYTITTAPLRWENYQRYLLQTPATPDSVGVTANTVFGITVDAILQPDRKYELVYFTNKFYAREVV